mmetsp:Transcript_11099/g.21473  ORF Transcript_11099/g.21473 Transcript_11099/m.21473 type:complete len:242 (+) Transcript_11099:1-726(+)
MSSKLTSTFFLFAVQFTLGLFYMYSLNNNKGGWENSSGFRWLISVLLVGVKSGEEIGKGFDFKFWIQLLRSKNSKMQHNPRFLGCGCSLSCRTEATIRMVMSIIVNGFMRRIILCTAPILLSLSDDPLDFVKDCLAVFFITNLDDLAESVNLEGDLVKKRKININKENEFGEEKWACKEWICGEDDVNESPQDDPGEDGEDEEDNKVTKQDLEDALAKRDTALESMKREIRALLERVPLRH